MIVVADTTPLNYLIQLGFADVLREIYGRVLVPPAVLIEMQHPEAPGKFGLGPLRLRRGSNKFLYNSWMRLWRLSSALANAKRSVWLLNNTPIYY